MIGFIGVLGFKGIRAVRGLQGLGFPRHTPYWLLVGKKGTHSLYNPYNIFPYSLLTPSKTLCREWSGLGRQGFKDP